MFIVEIPKHPCQSPLAPPWDAPPHRPAGGPGGRSAHGFLAAFLYFGVVFHVIHIFSADGQELHM